jgi:hypothetical protein
MNPLAKTLASLALVSFTGLLAGCSGSPDGDTDPTASSDDALSATQRAAFAGTWNVTDTNNLDLLFHSYTFKTDGTYSAIGGCPQSGAGPHCFAITTQTGKWKVTKSGPQLGAPGGVQELVLTDSFNQKDTYFFFMKNDVLSLSTVFHGQVTKLEHDPSTMKRLRSGDVCADSFGNSVGQCPEDLPCEFDGPSGNVQRCLPPI